MPEDDMPKHGAPEGAGRPDPVDDAYLRAETLLADEAARAARRARVLAAVAQKPTAAAVPAPTAASRSAWRNGRWLAAAGVAGLAVLVASQVYRPVTPQSAPVAKPRAAETQAPSAAAPHVATPPVARASAPPNAGPAPPAAQSPVRLKAPPPPASAPVASAPPPVEREPAPMAFPAAKPAVLAPVFAPPPPAPPPPPASAPSPAVTAPRAYATDGTSVGEVIVTAQKRSASTSLAARLHAAAAAGQTSEVETLLAHGAPVDGAGADGDTALMAAARADQPAAAAILRLHGASLDRHNKAGETARDLAAATDDPVLDQALAVKP